MIIDSRNEFCDAVALNLGAVGLYPVGSLVDLTAGLSVNQVASLKDIPGNSEGLYFVAYVQTTCTGVGASLKLHLQSDAQDPIVPGTATEHFITGAIPVATLVAGYRICCVEIPYGDYERFLGVAQETVGANFTAGKIDCFLTTNPPAQNILPDMIP